MSTGKCDLHEQCHGPKSDPFDDISTHDISFEGLGGFVLSSAIQPQSQATHAQRLPVCWNMQLTRRLQLKNKTFVRHADTDLSHWAPKITSKATKIQL